MVVELEPPPESDIVDVPQSSEFDYRVLYLSGNWHSSIGSQFRLQGLVYVQKDGSASGSLDWRSVRIAGSSRQIVGAETVCGAVCGLEVDLRGQFAEPGLATDHYRITLSGPDERGTFGGISRAYGDWCGRLQGQFYFRNRKT